MNPANEEILTAYIDGQLDVAQVDALQTRLQNEPELALLLEQLQWQSKQLRLLPGLAAKPDFAAQVLAAAERQGGFGGPKPAATKAAPNSRNWSIQHWSILASSVAALLLVGIFVFPQFFRPDGGDVTTAFNSTTNLPDQTEKTEPAAMRPAKGADQRRPGKLAEHDEIGMADNSREMKQKSIREPAPDSPVPASNLPPDMAAGEAGMKKEEHSASPGGLAIRDGKTESEKPVSTEKLASRPNAESLSAAVDGATVGGSGGNFGGGDGGSKASEPMPGQIGQNALPGIAADPPLENSKKAVMAIPNDDAKKFGEVNFSESAISQIWVVDLPKDEAEASELQMKLEAGILENLGKAGKSLPDGQVDLYLVRADDNKLNKELAQIKSTAVVLDVDRDLQSQLDTLVNRLQPKSRPTAGNSYSDDQNRSINSDRQREIFGEGQIEYLGRQDDFSARLQSFAGPTLKDKAGLGEQTDQAARKLGVDMPSNQAEILAKGIVQGAVADSERMPQTRQNYLILLRRIPQLAPVAPASAEPIK